MPPVGLHLPLRQASDLSVRLDVDTSVGGLFSQARHELDVTRERDNEASAGGWIDVAHGEREAARAALERWVMRERQVSLRHADRKRAHAALRQPVDAFLTLR